MSFLDRVYSNYFLRTVKDKVGRPIKHAAVGRQGIHLMIHELKSARGVDQVKTVFDVGAAVGDTARVFLKEFPSATIYCFEPLSRSYETLVARTRSGVNRMKYFHIALVDKPGQVTLNISSYSDASSIKPLSPVVLERGTPKVSTEVVEAKTLDQVCSEVGFHGQIDLLKIDVEGAEDMVLAGGSNTIKANVKNIYVELQPQFWGRRATNHIDFFQAMHGYGFEFIGNYGDYWFSKDDAVIKKVFE